MAATDAAGGQKYCYAGRPITRLAKGASNPGSCTYWYNGQVVLALYPLSVTYTAAVALTGGATTLAATNTFSPGTKTASVALLSAGSVLAATSTFSPGTKTAAAALLSPGSLLAATSTYGPGTKTASVALLSAGSILDASSTFSPGTKTATVDLLAAGSILDASSTFSPGTKTAVVDLLTVGSVLDATGTYGPGTKTATADLLTAGSILVAAGTFGPGTKTATVDLLSPGSIIDASSTFSPGTKTATVILLSPGSLLAAVATHVAPSYTATVVLVGGATTLAAVVVLVNPHVPHSLQLYDTSRRNIFIWEDCGTGSTLDKRVTSHVELTNGGTQQNAGIILNYHLVDPLTNPRYQYFIAQINRNSNRVELLRYNGTNLAVENFVTPGLPFSLTDWYEIQVSAVAETGSVRISVRIENISTPSWPVVSFSLLTNRWGDPDGYYGLHTDRAVSNFSFFLIENDA